MRGLLLAVLFWTVFALAAGAAKLGKVPGLEESSPEAAFKQADSNGDGELSAQEFEQSMTQAVSSMGNLEEAQLQQYTKMIRDKFSEFDSDQSGGISIVEWQTLSQAGQKAAEAAQQKKVAQENVQLQAVYNKADHDADGKLTQQEMLDGFSQYGYDSSQIDKFFKVGDADKDSLLTFQEFLAGREGMQRAKDLEAMLDTAKSEPEQLKAFTEADLNADGRLSLLEYTQAFQDFMAQLGADASSLDSKQIAQTFAEFDHDKDGKVTEDEWMTAVKRNLDATPTSHEGEAQAQAQAEALKAQTL